MFAKRRTGNKSVKIFSKAFKVLENKLPKRILKNKGGVKMTLKEIYDKYNYLGNGLNDLKLKPESWDKSDFDEAYVKLNFYNGYQVYNKFDEFLYRLHHTYYFDDDWYVLNPPPESNKPEKDPLDAVNDFLNEYKKALEILHLGIRKLIQDL